MLFCGKNLVLTAESFPSLRPCQYNYQRQKSFSQYLPGARPGSTLLSGSLMIIIIIISGSLIERRTYGAFSLQLRQFNLTSWQRCRDVYKYKEKRRALNYMFHKSHVTSTPYSTPWIVSNNPRTFHFFLQFNKNTFYIYIPNHL